MTTMEARPVPGALCNAAHPRRGTRAHQPPPESGCVITNYRCTSEGRGPVPLNPLQQVPWGLGALGSGAHPTAVPRSCPLTAPGLLSLSPHQLAPCVSPPDTAWLRGYAQAPLPGLWVPTAPTLGSAWIPACWAGPVGPAAFRPWGFLGAQRSGSQGQPRSLHC